WPSNRVAAPVRACASSFAAISTAAILCGVAPAVSASTTLAPAPSPPLHDPPGQSGHFMKSNRRGHFTCQQQTVRAGWVKEKVLEARRLRNLRRMRRSEISGEYRIGNSRRGWRKLRDVSTLEV